MVLTMHTLPKSASLDNLDLPDGDHWVKFHVKESTISFEVAASVPGSDVSSNAQKPTGFVDKWGGSVRKEESADDSRLQHIHSKHLR